MTRKDFLKMCGLLGIGLPLLKTSARESKSSDSEFSGQVIVIGAGAAGLTAAHLLNQYGIKVKIIEAQQTYGGRMKRTTEFADFPIPLGAEWLHTDRDVLNQILHDSTVDINTVTKPYDFTVDRALVDGELVSLKNLDFTIDQKFINTTWFDFFEQYIVPGIADRISFNEVVQSIDYSSDKISITTSKTTHIADKVVITVPVKLLQNGDIKFTPPLPAKKTKAIKRVTVWPGCKAFIKFSKKFYPAVVGFDDEYTRKGHKLYYDAAYGQHSKQNIMGLFAVGAMADPYLSQSEETLIKYILNELDELFDGQASKHYLKHIFQNWVQEPYAQGAYLPYFESWRTLRTLRKPVDDKLFFAGDAYTDGSDWSSVHAAALSAKQLIEEQIG